MPSRDSNVRNKIVFIIIWHLNAPDSFYEYLCVLFSKCLLYGYMPSAMVLSTLIYIPKDNNDTQNSDKY